MWCFLMPPTTTCAGNAAGGYGSPIRRHGTGVGSRVLPFYLGILQQRIVGEKTLFFGTDCTAASETQRLGSEDVDRRMTDYPGAAALLWAVAEMDLNRRRGEAREHLGPADRLGGY